MVVRFARLSKISLSLARSAENDSLVPITTPFATLL